MIEGGGGLISAGLKKYRKIIISLSDMWSRRTDQTQCCVFTSVRDVCMFVLFSWLLLSGPCEMITQL